MPIRAALVLAASVLAVASSAHAVVLYDGSLGTTPTQQGLTYIPLGNASNTTAGGSTTLNTTSDNSVYAGFGTNALTLDRNAGYTIRVDARLLAESHASDSRAGFSLLILSSDLRGIELGFHGDEIFAQNDNPLFVRAESVATNTLASLTKYEVAVLGNTYTLKANGVAILTNALRNYSAFVGPINPYSTPNSIFLGDDSTSAQASTQFSYVGVTVPEPMSVGAIGAIALAMRRRRAV